MSAVPVLASRRWYNCFVHSATSLGSRKAEGSDANRTWLNQRAAIRLPITAVVTGMPGCIIAPETHPLLADSRPIFFYSVRRAARGVQVNTDH